MTSAERNTEIWSTRLQRELLALTSDNAPAESQDEITGVLPDFVSVKDHELSIEKGECVVSFNIRPSTDMTDPIIISLDASLRKDGSGKIDPTVPAYPFSKPTATLKNGSNNFPKGSTIKDGDYVDIEMDWTPSLHLTDAILNISLKVKESILQSEPFHPAAEVPQGGHAVGEMVDKAKRMGESVKDRIKGVANKLEKNSPSKKAVGQKKKTGRRDQIRIGDEISMLDGPWVDCKGVYSCKAIRRPTFVEEAMATAARNRAAKEVRSSLSSSFWSLDDNHNDDGDVPGDLGGFMRAQAGYISQASPGLAGAFSKIANSARGVLEESFLMITENHIIEMRSSKLNLSTGHIAFAIPIEMLAKLKFRRQESISLFFKPAPDDPLIYMCPDSSDCVHQIQSVLKRHGVKGKHTNAATHRAVNQALHLVQEIQTMELALKHDPSVERVNEIMDLYRQAAERFESAGDIRHEEVVTHMRKFLALPLTIGILDGSYSKDSKDDALTTSGENGDVEGVVLEKAQSEEDEKKVPEILPTEGGGGLLGKLKESAALNDDKAFHDNMENILKEAEADLANLKMEDDPELEIMMEEQEGYSGDLGDDAIAEFENMLKAADDELAALMSS